ncbi:MAG: hypothetical protein JST63_02035 [Bacteroidetes bacterium]|nr:hypothetical protein [Bacteroidota bacterium]
MRRFLLTTLLLFIIAAACKKPPGARSMRGLWVKNNGTFPICTFTSFQYPDTTIPDLTGREWDLETISPAESAVYDFPIRNWKELFEQLPADTLSLFVFHADTIQKYGWQEIRNEYKILKRIDLSQRDVENMNSTIQYP